MKILAIGDAHITGNRPENRIDNYWATVLRKLDFILEIARKERVSVIVSPGDFTDTPSLSYSEFSDVVELFKGTAHIPFLVTFGQHDMRYRTKLNTALSAFHTAIPNFRILLSGDFKIVEDTKFYGCAYNEEMPACDKNSVLLIHKMIVGKDTKAWHEHVEFELASKILRESKCQYIISGDNHQQFISHSLDKKKWLFNCGAMMRNKVDMLDFEPYIVLIDTLKMEHKKIFIPIESAEDIFAVDKVLEKKERNEHMEAFISGLTGHKELSLSFEDNLNLYIRVNKIDPAVAKIARESLKERS